jgi:hypothetical protein
MFSCQFNLSQHVREVHTDERPFKCHLCGPTNKGFNRNYCLLRHLEKVHGLKGVHPGRGKVYKRRPKGMGDGMMGLPPPVVEKVSCGFIAFGCGHIFSSEDEMLLHCHRYHGMAVNPACACTACKAVYGGLQAQNPAPQQVSSVNGGWYGMEQEGNIDSSKLHQHQHQGPSAMAAVPMHAGAAPNGMYPGDMFPTAAPAQTFYHQEEAMTDQAGGTFQAAPMPSQVYGYDFSDGPTFDQGGGPMNSFSNFNGADVDMNGVNFANSESGAVDTYGVPEVTNLSTGGFSGVSQYGDMDDLIL